MREDGKAGASDENLQFIRFYDSYDPQDSTIHKILQF